MGPGEKTEMQSRPAVVAIAVVGGEFSLIMPEGRTVEAERESGRSIDMDAVDHATENIGTSDAHVALGEFE